MIHLLKPLCLILFLLAIWDRGTAIEPVSIHTGQGFGLPVVKSHRPRSNDEESQNQVLLRWQSESCAQLKVMIKKKMLAITKLKEAIKGIERSKKIPEDEKPTHITR